MIKSRLMFIYDLKEDELDHIINSYRKLIILYKKLLDKRNFLININLDLNNRVCLNIHNKKDIFKKIVYLYKINMIHLLDYLPMYLNITKYESTKTLNNVLDKMINSIHHPETTLILDDTLSNVDYIKKYSDKNVCDLLDIFNELVSLKGIISLYETNSYDLDNFKKVINEMFLYIIINCKNNDFSMYIKCLEGIIDDPIRFYEKIKMNNLAGNMKDFLDMEFLSSKKELIIK